MNRWNIPLDVERLVADRDRACVYCQSPFAGKEGPYRRRPSWEHIINDLTLVTAGNIVLCCVSCNSSKGAKPIEAWLASPYCQKRAITVDTVSAVVRKALRERVAAQSTAAGA